MGVVDNIRKLFQQRGDSLYGGESVTQLEHALQAAWAAEKSETGAALITSALLHDVGHLLHDLPDEAPDEGTDDRHEQTEELWRRATGLLDQRDSRRRPRAGPRCFRQVYL